MLRKINAWMNDDPRNAASAIAVTFAILLIVLALSTT
jgi:hypothetical protein